MQPVTGARSDLAARLAWPVFIAAVPTSLAAGWASYVFGERCRELECIGVVWFWAALAGALLGFATGVVLLRRRGATRLGRAGRGTLVALGAIGLAFALFVLLAESDHWL